MPIRSYHFVVIGFLVGCLLACSPQKEDKYADIPEELAGLYKAISEDPHNADLYLDLSRYYANAGQLDSALSNVLIAIRFDSTNSNAYIAVADVYLSMKDLETTEEMLKKEIALDTKNN
jgi:tetratricopeptide (TPR) repeat protein